MYSGALSKQASAACTVTGPISSFRVTSASFQVTSKEPVSWQISLRGIGGNDESTSSMPVVTCGSTRTIALKQRIAWTADELSSVHIAWIHMQTSSEQAGGRYAGIVHYTKHLEPLTVAGSAINIFPTLS
jgi:hypothetical protein